MAQSEAQYHRLQEWQESLWLLIALLTPLFVNLWVEQQFEASKVWLLRTLVWLLFLVWLGGRLAGNRIKPLTPPIRTLIIALGSVLVLSTFLSTNRYIAVYGSLDRAGGLLTQLSYLLLFVIVATQIDAQGSRRLLHLMIWTALPICLLGLVQAAGWQPLPVFTDARSQMTATLGRANFTGAYLALLLPLTAAAVLEATNRWQRVGLGALVALEVTVIALSQARAAWIAALVGISLFLWLPAARRWSTRVRWLSMLGGAATLGAGLLIVLRQGITTGGSIAARWTIWQASLRLLWPRLWLGYGADTLELHFPSVYPPELVYYQGRGVVVDRAHNWLLDWSLNYGIVATLMLIGLVVLILSQGWQQLTMSEKLSEKWLDSAQSRDAYAHAGSFQIAAEQTSLPSGADQPLEHRWLAACMAAICAQLVGNLFLFEVASTAVVFWLLLAIVTATAGSFTEPRPLFLPSLRTGGIPATVGMVFVGLALWQFNVQPLLADLHSWRGAQALSNGNPAAASAQLDLAVQRQPRRAGYHVAAALTAAQQGEYAQAESAMHQAMVLRPQDPVLATQLAAIYAQDVVATPEKIDLAYDAYEWAIELAPTIALTYRQYADLALRSGDGQRAQLMAEQAVDLDATDGIAYGILGWAHLQNGDPAAAQAAFEQAVRWQPDSADFFLGLATVHLEQDRVDAARQALQQSLALDPGYVPSLTLRSHLEHQ